MHKIDKSKLKGKSILLMAPIYGGQSFATFDSSVSKLQKLAKDLNFDLDVHFIMNESLVQRGRNTLCHEFMASDYTHLLFVDADIGFSPEDVFRMLCWEKDIIGGVYNKKCINWNKVWNAVKNGVRADQLQFYCGDFATNPIERKTMSFNKWEPIKVKHIATGFMLISRKCFESFQEKYPEWHYRNNHFHKGRFQTDDCARLWAYFDTGIEFWEPEKDRTYLSEDYWFCDRMQKIGFDIWMCPWIYLTHIGTYVYGAEFGCSYSPEACATPEQYQQFKLQQIRNNMDLKGLTRKKKK